jgi:glycosyltransferase involved in cell wall biosynthesis
MTAPLQVAFDMTFPERNLAGTATYARELLYELRRRDDLTITTVAGGDRGGILDTMRWLVDGASRALAGAQVVHCPAFVAPWRIGTPLVLTVHDTSSLHFPQDHPLEWRTYARFFLPERARAATCVITGTEYTRRGIVRDLGVLEDRVAVTPYGVSQRFAQPGRSQPSVADPPHLLFPGAPSKRKNLELVLTAMAKAPEGTQLKRARLLISGATAEQFPQYRALIDSLGLTGRVEWCGRVSDDAMPKLVAEVDLLVYPSLYEGFGFPPLEAMVAGTPVVASNAACLPEVLGDGALLIDPNDTKQFIDAVEAVLTRTELRCDLVAKAKTWVARYTWARCADRTVNVYRRAAATKP